MAQEFKEQALEGIKESDLFDPLWRFFTQLGYKVNGEIKSCDLVASLEDHLIVVEIKLNLNLEVILQASERQKIGNQVYIAVLKPKRFKMNQRLKRIMHLLRRLEIGLIMVSPSAKDPIEILQEAVIYDREKSRAQSKKKREQVFHELGKRRQLTTGGVTKTKIMTAYREDAILIAQKLYELGEAAPKAIVLEEVPLKRVQSILTNNHYGWFTRIKRGIYATNELWQKEMSRLMANE